MIDDVQQAKTLIIQKTMISDSDETLLSMVKHICKNDCFLRFEELSMLDVKYILVFNEIQNKRGSDEIEYTYQIILSIQ